MSSDHAPGRSLNTCVKKIVHQVVFCNEHSTESKPDRGRWRYAPHIMARLMFVARESAFEAVVDKLEEIVHYEKTGNVFLWFSALGA